MRLRALCLSAVLLLSAAAPAGAEDALVLTMTGFSADTELAAEEIVAMLEAAGYTAELREPAPMDPLADIDTFSCVFDVRPELAFLPPDWFQPLSFVTALANGTNVLFVGEHLAFAQRNESIREVLEFLDAGPLAFDDTPLPPLSLPGDWVQPTNPSHELASGCHPITELVYDGIDHGRFVELGTGTWVSGAPDLAGTVAWDHGDIPFALDARALVILDINAVSPISTLDFFTLPVPGVEPTQNRPFLENAIAWLCGSPGAPDVNPCVQVCEPRNHGFWHRWCLGQDAIDPGRFGLGLGPGPSPQHEEIPGDTMAKADAAMAPHGLTACEALDAGPFADERLAALRELATIHLNVSAGWLSLGCPVELHPVVDDEADLTVGDAIRLMEERLAEDTRRALREARWIGEHVVNREALLPVEAEE